MLLLLWSGLYKIEEKRESKRLWIDFASRKKMKESVNRYYKAKLKIQRKTKTHCGYDKLISLLYKCSCFWFGLSRSFVNSRLKVDSMAVIKTKSWYPKMASTDIFMLYGSERHMCVEFMNMNFCKSVRNELELKLKKNIE